MSFDTKVNIIEHCKLARIDIPKSWRKAQIADALADIFTKTSSVHNGSLVNIAAKASAICALRQLCGISIRCLLYTSSPELRMMTETYRKRLAISKQFADQYKPEMPAITVSAVSYTHLLLQHLASISITKNCFFG